MRDIVVTYYRATSAIVAHPSLMDSNTGIPGNGTATIRESRILVGLLSARIIERRLVLFIVASLALISLASRRPKASPAQVLSIAFAAVLSYRRGFDSLLSGKGSTSVKSLKPLLEGRLLYSNTDSSHYVTAITDVMTRKAHSRILCPPRSISYFAILGSFLNITGQVFGFAALVALIIVLAVVPHISERNNGPFLVSQKQVVETLKGMSTCLSQFRVTTLFSTQDFAVRTLAIYSRCQLAPVSRI